MTPDREDSMTTENPQCTKKVFKDGYHHPCTNPVTIRRDGKSYCRIHDPEYIKERNRKREKRWDAERKESDKGYELEAARNKATAGLTLEQLRAVTPQKIAAIPEICEALKELMQSILDEKGLASGQVDGWIKAKHALAKAEEK